MADFYPFTCEDIPELFPVGQRHLITVKSWLQEWGDQNAVSAVSFLLPLAIDLLDNVERIRGVKNDFQVEYGINTDAKISEGFLQIVKAYLEENNGARDLSPITELMKSYGHMVFAKHLETFFLQYSLPASSNGGGISGSKEYFWNNNSVEQALENSGILEELLKKPRADLLRRHLEQALVTEDWRRKYRKEKAISLLLPLAMDLLEDVERIRALKNALQEKFGENRYAESSDEFLKIVMAYLEENGGTGSLFKLTDVLSSNGHLRIAECLEKFFLQYFLRARSKGSENANASSEDVLQTDKKNTAGNSMEKALQNHVILEEIFGKLQVEDQKLFRVVSPAWMEQTLPFWRRNARILLQVSQSGVSLSQYMDFWEMNKEMTKEEVDATAKAMQRLLDLPFRSIRVFYCHPNTLYSSTSEKKFWRLCCWQIEDLKIRTTLLNTTKLCKFMLKGFCRNLKQLEIKCLNWQTGPDRDPVSSDEEEDRTEDEDIQGQLVHVKRIKTANKLHTLILNKINAEALRRILFICPKLKELHLWQDEGAIGALLSPTSTGDFIKLEKLVVLEFRDTVHDFRLLRRYTQMLTKNRFEPISLKHLQLQTRLSNARSGPFNLYAALALVSKNIKTLQLGLIVTEDYKSDKKLDWFMDLSPFAFPNLTKLNLVIDFQDVCDRFGLNFDFGTLKGMPMLEKLKIYIKNPKREVSRKAGTQNWVFEGNRSRYLPTWLTVDYQYSAEDPILCSNLKEFTFDGWSLNEEDLRLLSSWFPNLTHLEAGVNHESLPVFLENWPHMEKLVIYTGKLISLRTLRPLKEARKRIQIFQRFSNEDRAEVEVVLKEKNGWPFFST